MLEHIAGNISAFGRGLFKIGAHICSIDLEQSRGSRLTLSTFCCHSNVHDYVSVAFTPMIKIFSGRNKNKNKNKKIIVLDLSIVSRVI